MKKNNFKLLAVALCLFGGIATTNAQVGVGTTKPNADAALDVTSTNKGLLLPRVQLVSTDNPSPLSAHVAGMLVWNSGNSGTGTTAVTPGVYYNDGTKWGLLSGTTAAQLHYPVARTVAISGTATSGSTLTGTYTYYSADAAVESGTTKQWYIATDQSGNTDQPIAGATGTTYVVQAGDAGKYIRYGVTPGAQTGPTPGAAAYSAYVGVGVTLTAPVAQNVTIGGTLQAGNTATASYTYYSANGAAESGTTFQWYSATDASGTGKTAITGANAKTYNIQTADMGKYLMVTVTPGAATGPTPGTAGNSSYVQVANTVSVNGLTYGIITSPTTGKVWLDRNIGATRVATSSTDYAAYGSLFQWGRPADGHELINWTSSTAGTARNGTTTTLATTDAPGNALFISASATPYDWRSGNNNNRWATAPQGPCPAGFQVPTQTQWANEGITNSAKAFSLLQMPVAGYRNYGNGSLNNNGLTGSYWSSTVAGTSMSNLYVTSSSASLSGAYRSAGESVRCIAQ